MTVLRFLLIITWSASLVELGLPILLDQIGYSLFFLSGLLTIAAALPLFLASNIRVLRPDLSSLSTLLIVAIIIYHVYGAISVAWSWTPQSSAFYVVQSCWYMALFLFSYVIYRNQKEITALKDFSSIGIIVILSFSVLTAVAVYRGYGWGVFEELRTVRLALFKDYNMYTQCVLMAVSFAMVRIKDRTPTKMHLAIYLLGTLIAILIGTLSGSRRAMILYGPLTVLVVFMLTSARRPVIALKILFLASVLASTVVLVLYNAVPDVEESSESDSTIVETTITQAERGLGFFTGEYAQVSNRFQKWEHAAALIGELGPGRLFFGIGEKAYRDDERFVREGGGADSPHNFVLAAIIEGGLVRLGLLFFIIGLSITMAIQLRRQRFWQGNAAIAGMAIWIVSVSISADGFFHARIIYLLLLFIAISHELTLGCRQQTKVTRF